jgi:hypothetical protein
MYWNMISGRQISTVQRNVLLPSSWQVMWKLPWNISVNVPYHVTSQRRKNNLVTFQVLTVMLKIQVFWDVLLCHCVNSYQCLELSQCIQKIRHYSPSVTAFQKTSVFTYKPSQTTIGTLKSECLWKWICKLDKSLVVQADCVSSQCQSV